MDMSWLGFDTTVAVADAETGQRLSTVNAGFGSRAVDEDGFEYCSITVQLAGVSATVHCWFERRLEQ